ncbi:A/G-specific adenine glycosylase [Abyssalbus ytuae]|uniref:Adenine DNA glycosylase n=1 Tax=Abyssalbus ytuae TaxID=2926907 RepID=A0A9E7CSG1_9FLAO|nr:A/G-specific adenine glycosylase [Abyssalbus ytuae]UOB16226.1 A/G-specific adenine glycosylase [Abyssalbus ytuae]
MNNFKTEIISWYSANKRSLPWRETSEPYCIWLSEIMSQQTRIEQSLPYYLKFIDAYPTIFHLAEAKEDEVLKLWQGLGYYSRARNLHATAKYIAYELNGKFPDNYNDLLKLKGVGDYTASAIASICFNEPAPVVDGNVYRVLSRYFGVDIPINSTKGIKYFKTLAKELIDHEQPGEYNQGIMEFGARQCKPQSPDCNICPLNESCVALQKKMVALLPVKIKKGKIKHRHFNYLIINNDEKTILEQRTANDIWKNLYEFPLIEDKHELTEEQIIKHDIFKKYIPHNKFSIHLYNNDKIVHKLSHQYIHTKFWIVNLQTKIENGIEKKQLNEYPVPILIANFVEEFSF